MVDSRKNSKNRIVSKPVDGIRVSLPLSALDTLVIKYLYGQLTYQEEKDP